MIVIKLLNDPSQAILVWPAVGIGIITALVWGIKVLPGLYLAQLAINVILHFHSNETYTILNFAVSNVFIIAGLIRCYLGAYLIKYFIGYPNSLITYQSILKFFLIIGPLTTFLSTIVYDVVRLMLGYLESLTISRNFFDWWFGDLLGFIIFAPFTMIFICQPKSIWRPRYLSVGLPVIIIFITVIFIFNKTELNDSHRVLDNLDIKNEILITKLNQHNIWVDKFTDNANDLAFSKHNPNNKLINYFKSLKNSGNGSNAIIYLSEGESHYIKSSSSYSEENFKALKKINIKQLINQYENDSLPTSSTRYLEEVDQFINIYEFAHLDPPLTTIVFFDLLKNLELMLKGFNLDHTKLSLDLNNLYNDISLIDSREKFSNQNVSLKSVLFFKDENWTLTLTPSNKYLYSNQSNLSSIIAKLGFLFAGLIGIMLLIITGKTAFTDIQVNERTLDLDHQAKDLRNRKKQYQKLIEQHPVILWRQNIESNKMSYISSKVEEHYGYPLTRWLTEENFWLDHIHHEDRENVKKTIAQSIKTESSFELEYRFVKPDASIVWINDVININHDLDFNTQLVGLMIDITEIKEAKIEQSISESKYRILFKHAVDPLMIINLDDFTIRDPNDKAIALFGYNISIGDKSLSDFSPTTQADGCNSEKRLKKIYKKLNTDKSMDFEWIMLNDNNQEIICNIEMVKLPQQNNNIALANINDITEKRLHEKKINQLAYYDNLTKLPNREYFYSKFEYFHQLASEKQQFGTIIYLDLDRFKILNDSLGHQAGDILLKMVAERIRNVTRKNDFCARLGGDEFIILTKKLKHTIESSLESSLVKSELILEALNEPYQLGDYEHLITPSIGISVFPAKNTSTDQVIHQADIAMYASKDKGKNTITVYQSNMVKLVNERLMIEKAIRQAFDNNEFQLYYQPQYNENNEIFSVEALLRWDKSSEYNINTEDIIITIEKIGLTHDLGYWVFDTACSQLQQWQNQGHTIESVSINVSARQFHQKLFIDQVKSVIESYNLNPSQITIELTEAVIIEDMVSLINKLNELRDYGVRTSLDDFGTGYSSLAYLKHLPIDQLKIDIMFIHDLSFDESSQHIVEMIIKLAKSMHIELIAEGIEIVEQFEILKNLGCKNFQGFYFSKPKSGDLIF